MEKHTEHHSEFTGEREEGLKPYGELAERVKKDESAIEQAQTAWGVASYKGDTIPLYSSEELVRDVFTSEILPALPTGQQSFIADFGGGEGLLLNMVTGQLKDMGLLVKSVDVDITWKHLVEANNKGHVSYAIKTDLNKSVPFSEHAFAAGMSRYVIQYLAYEDQADFMQRLLPLIKPGQPFIMQWPAATRTPEEAQTLNDFLAQADAIATGKDYQTTRENRYYPSLKDVESYVEQTGRSACTDYVPDLEVYLSAGGYIDRFKVDDSAVGDRLKEHFTDARHLLEGIDSVSIYDTETGPVIGIKDAVVSIQC